MSLLLFFSDFNSIIMKLPPSSSLPQPLSDYLLCTNLVDRDKIIPDICIWPYLKKCLHMIWKKPEPEIRRPSF